MWNNNNNKKCNIPPNPIPRTRIYGENVLIFNVNTIYSIAPIRSLTGGGGGGGGGGGWVVTSYIWHSTDVRAE